MLVVDYLTEKWAKDPKMSDYLRPKTLFAPENCVEYFDKAKKWDTAGRAWANGKWVNNDQAFKSSYAEVNYTVPAGSAHEQTLPEVGWWKIHPTG
jgi:hypothetical protein